MDWFAFTNFRHDIIEAWKAGKKTSSSISASSSNSPFLLSSLWRSISSISALDQMTAISYWSHLYTTSIPLVSPLSTSRFCYSYCSSSSFICLSKEKRSTLFFYSLLWCNTSALSALIFSTIYCSGEEFSPMWFFLLSQSSIQYHCSTTSEEKKTADQVYM